MNNNLIQTIKIGASQINYNAEVGLISALNLIQDNMCEFYKNINCDGITLIPKCNSFFVVTKTKIRFLKPIKWLDVVTMQTNIYRLSNVRNCLCAKIILDNEKCIDCIQELCCMDYVTRGLRTIDTIENFPKNLEIVDCYSDLKFDKLPDDFCDKKDVSIVKINSGNLDFYGHTNNVEYLKILMQTLDYEFLKNILIEECEVHYLKETKLGDELKIYKKLQENFICFLIKKVDVEILKAKIKFKKY